MSQEDFGKLIKRIRQENNLTQKDLAEKYNVKLAINLTSKGHIDDFNFAYKLANTKYVTLCHQDDIYYENFAEETLNKLKKKTNNDILLY